MRKTARPSAGSRWTLEKIGLAADAGTDWMQGMKFVSWLLLFPAMISAAPVVIDDAALV